MTNNPFRKHDNLVEAVKSVLRGETINRSDRAHNNYPSPEYHEETLDEISSDTVDSYYKKAKKQYNRDGQKVRWGQGTDAAKKRYGKRHKGLGSAVKRKLATTHDPIHPSWTADKQRRKEMSLSSKSVGDVKKIYNKTSTTEETVNQWIAILEDYSKDLHDYHNDMSDHHYDKSEHHDSAASHHGRNGNQKAQDSHISASKSHDMASNSHYDAAQALKKHGHQSQQYKDAASKAKKHSDTADRSGLGSNRAYPVKK
jgi:hypothetical protein